jgi:DNA-binding response OmpR family regulator
MLQILIIGQKKENVNQIQTTLENDFSHVVLLSDLEKFDRIASANTIDLVIVEETHISKIETSKNFFIDFDIPILLIAEKNKLIKYSNNNLISDIISIPVNSEELLYRVRKITNIDRPIDNKNKIAVGDLMIDLEKYTVSVEKKIIDLTFKEFELLSYLANNIDTPFTRDSLLDKVWGYDYIGGYRTVDVHIRRIRSKIERNFQYIQTVRNIGYRFIDPKENN